MKQDLNPFLVLVADASPVTRTRLADLLRKLPGVDMVSETANAADTLCLIRNVRLDLVILDVMLPAGGGMEVLRQMREEKFQTRVILLANHPAAEYEQQAREHGVTAVLDKSREIMKVAELTLELTDPAARRF